MKKLFLFSVGAAALTAAALQVTSHNTVGISCDKFESGAHELSVANRFKTAPLSELLYTDALSNMDYVRYRDSSEDRKGSLYMQWVWINYIGMKGLFPTTSSATVGETTYYLDADDPSTTEIPYGLQLIVSRGNASVKSGQGLVYLTGTYIGGSESEKKEIHINGGNVTSDISNPTESTIFLDEVFTADAGFAAGDTVIIGSVVYYYSAKGSNNGAHWYRIETITNEDEEEEDVYYYDNPSLAAGAAAKAKIKNPNDITITF